jgi:hypothetical protein
MAYLIKLTGNPYNVVRIFSGGTSFGFDDADMYEYNHCKNKVEKEVSMIIEAYKSHGYEIEPAAAFYAWKEYSNDLQAGWLIVDGRDIIDCTSRYLIEKTEEKS